MPWHRHLERVHLTGKEEKLTAFSAQPRLISCCPAAAVAAVAVIASMKNGTIHNIQLIIVPFYNPFLCRVAISRPTLHFNRHHHFSGWT